MRLNIFTVIILLIIIGFIVTLVFIGCKKQDSDTDCIDGGVKKYNSGKDAPKSIVSTEIVSFNCEFSLITVILDEESELDGRFYSLSAVLENGNVRCKIQWYKRIGGSEEKEFTKDVSFMTNLQKIISSYNLAQYNGYISKVSGLPDMYGVSLNVKYTSGESIYTYNNQDCFIPIDALKSFVELFDS